MSRARFAFGMLGFGYAFLYLPLALVMSVLSGDACSCCSACVRAA